MSEEIALASADLAAQQQRAQLAAIRDRAERLLYEYGEDREGAYVISAYLWDGITRVIDLEEPDEDERFALHFAAQAGQDVRALLHLLDQSTTEATQLRRALRHFGHHKRDCALQYGGCCSCGLSDARREPR